MTARKFLSGTATLAVFVVGTAAFLSAQDMSAYPTLVSLTFAGWLLVSAGVVAVLTIPGLAILGAVILAERFCSFAFRRRQEPEPSPPNPPAPAALVPADIDAEWADTQAEFKGE